MTVRNVLVAIILTSTPGLADAADDPVALLRIDPGHPWRPPFGLDRVGRPLMAVVEFPGADRPVGAWSLAWLKGGRELGRREVVPPEAPPFLVRIPIDPEADEVALDAGPARVARRAVERTRFEADAVARPSSTINPVDLGTILVPDGWLLLGPGQGGHVDLAACRRAEGLPASTRVSAWYASNPSSRVDASLDLPAGVTVRARLALPPTPPAVDRDSLVAAIASADGVELWRKAIPTMIVRRPPALPAFGATRLKLRFDAPISVRDRQTGTFSTIPYDNAWDPALDDVVVTLPNSGRFVFWRGASYIPFWAGEHNTGLCTEWAENLDGRPDAVDCVEPLMDKELRYGRVEVVESTPARVHVRWTYQSTDLHYKVWGDSASEDYYFYPDGFGTRALSLKCAPGSEYELSELILIAPQDAHPFRVVAPRPIDVLGLDGTSRSIAFPVDRVAEAELRRSVRPPAVYRARLHPDERRSAVYFNPNEVELPPLIFAPFFDQGEVATPTYWGSHWPLARGNATGNAIDDRIGATPSHNSLMSWARSRPSPIESATVETLDASGRSRTMQVRRWAWLIGMTDATDARLREWAASYARPPSLDVRGGRIGFDAYASDRRALRVAVDGPGAIIVIKPVVPVVNPVFELIDAPSGPLRVTLDGRVLGPVEHAWDGRVLWIDATIAAEARLGLAFGPPGRLD